MRYAIRFTGAQHAQLQHHLFLGDGLEAAAFIPCGRINGTDRQAFCARRVVLIPYDDCQRTVVGVDSPTWFADALIEQAMRMAIVKIHGQPGGYEAFSERDDQADRSFFGSVAWRRRWVTPGVCRSLPAPITDFSPSTSRPSTG